MFVKHLEKTCILSYNFKKSMKQFIQAWPFCGIMNNYDGGVCDVESLCNWRHHIGLKYASHEQSTTLAQSRIASFEGVVQTANEENCVLSVITGDLFENTYSHRYGC